MKSANQKVYLYISDLEEFKLLYDFNAEAGDTFKIWANDNECNCIDSLDITSVFRNSFQKERINKCSTIA